MSTAGTKQAHERDETTLQLVLAELQRNSNKLDSLTEAQGKTALKVELMHGRMLGVFGVEGGSGGAFGRLKRKVAQHDKYFNYAAGILLSIPVIGGLLGWLVEHLAPGTIVRK